jgi:pantetheine-phosphate adenylyltransferase
MIHLAIYPGSFDPPTFGHLDVVDRASKIFPRVVVALGLHPRREGLFEMDERVELLQEVTRSYDNVEVDRFDGLLVEYARGLGARVLVRGLRAQTDFEYELHISAALSVCSGAMSGGTGSVVAGPPCAW